jgi:exosortase
VTTEANPPPGAGTPSPSESPPPAGETAPTRWLGLSVAEWSVVLLLGVAFAPAFVAMSRVWSSVDYQSHGYLVPFVALWAASGKRRALARTPAARDLRGLALLLAAFGLYLVGFASSWVALQGLSVVAGVAGGVLYLRGPAWLRTLVFPIGYLLFMVPVPEPILTPVVVQLQLLVSQAGVWLLQLGGVPVLRNGNVIELPGDVSLFVAEACSGITSLVTLLPLGVFLAYFTEKSLARRLVLVAAVLPLALGGNLVRVIATVLAAREVGVEAATAGAGHQAAGLVAYVLACLALLAIGRLMRVLVPPAPDPAGSA